MFKYRNKNTDQVVEYAHRSARLEFLQNWETLTADDPAPAPAQHPGLLGAKSVADLEVPATVVVAAHSEVATEIVGPDPANRPSKSALKDEWVSWAVECGLPRDEAEASSKADLIEIYGE